jgi:hypothetical protein
VALAFVVVAWWLLTHRIDRFWLPALPAAALLAGAGAFWSEDRWWRRGVLAVLYAGLVYSLLAIVSFAGADQRYFMGLARLRVDPASGPQGGRVDPAHLYLNAHAAPGEAVLLVGDAAPFDLEIPVYYNTVFDDDWFVALVKGRSPQEVRHELAQRHIRWVYVKWSEIRRYRLEGNYGYPDFAQPAVFDRLVKDGVLEPPIVGLWQKHGEIYGAGGLTLPGPPDAL